MWALSVYAKKLLCVALICQVIMLGTLGTGQLAPTQGSTMPELLALEAAQRILDICSDGAPD